MGKGKAPTYATLEELLAPRAATSSGMPEDDFTLVINGIDRLVRVRALTRSEALSLRDTEGGAAAFERVILSTAMVAPVVSQEQVIAWQSAAVAVELEPLVNKITGMSGLTDEKAVAKAAVIEFEADPDAEFRALPGGEADADGGGAPDVAV
jgi:hypothetical protein